MRLFDETESKYYELISYLLLEKRDFTGGDVDRLYRELFVGEKDFDTVDALFTKSEGAETLFTYRDGKYGAATDIEFPVVCNDIEKNAFYSLSSASYAELFLQAETLDQIRKSGKRNALAWENNDICIKNRHVSANKPDTPDQGKLQTIVKAIVNRQSILYDNAKEGAYSFKDEHAFPVKIEYSLLNDSFRISAYRPDQNRFFKMTLETMSNVRLGTSYRESLQDDYRKFLASNKRTVVLDVEPVGHVIERCFRIFSFYERRAVYDREDRRYRLEIEYYSYDEAEVIRDLLSLGSSVVVLEPSGLRKRVYERIVRAGNLYERE